MADNPTCSTCRWWETEGSSCPSTFGFCRLRAPTRCGPVDRSEGHPYPGWPPTTAEDWCGEHAPRVEAPVGSAPNAGPSAEYANFTAKVAELLGATDKARMDVDVDRAAIAVREAWPKGDA